MRLRLLGLALMLSLTAGCGQNSERSVADGSDPAFDPIAFFAGHTHSWGVLENRAGVPTEWIVTDSHGRTESADRLQLVQSLSFQDGSTQRRDWVLSRTGPGQYDATANDMVGSAKGEANGSVFHWQWVLARSPGNMLMNVTMNQWMYRMADGSVTIRTTISKFGLIVAEVTEQFVRAEHG